MWMPRGVPNIRTRRHIRSSEDVHSQIVSQSYFATVLYSKGRFDEALVNFEQAEQLDREDYLRSSLRNEN